MVSFVVSTLDDGRVQATFALADADPATGIVPSDSLIMSQAEWDALTSDDRDAMANARIAAKAALWAASAATAPQTALAVDTADSFQVDEVAMQAASGATGTVVKSYPGAAGGKLLLVLKNVVGSFVLNSVVGGVTSKASGNVLSIGG